MSDMTPNEARKILDDGLLHLTEIEMDLYLEGALRTIVAVGEALSWIEGAQARASEDWHRTLDPRAQHEMIAHQRDADWLRTATGDTDEDSA